MSFNVTKQMVNAEVTQFYQEYPRSDITIDTVVTDNILDRRLSLACGPNDFQIYRDGADPLRELTELSHLAKQLLILIMYFLLLINCASTNTLGTELSITSILTYTTTLISQIIIALKLWTIFIVHHTTISFLYGQSFMLDIQA